LPEWRTNLGHAHPDAGTFTLFSRGVFLVNGAGGYSQKYTAYTSTLLIDGKGQSGEGTAFQGFEEEPYSTLDKIHLSKVWLGRQIAAAEATLAPAYPASLGLTMVRRRLMLIDGRFLVVRDDVSASQPHRYEARFHGDQAAVEIGAGRFTMTNGAGRLAIVSLNPAAESKIEPTVVETELYKFTRLRPQLRGVHLSFLSPKSESFQFLTAMAIESSNSPTRFEASASEGRRIDLKSEGQTCRVWMERDKELDGDWAFTLRAENEPIVTLGLNGRSLQTRDAKLILSRVGKIVVRRVGSIWELESFEGEPMSGTFQTFEADGKIASSYRFDLGDASPQWQSLSTPARSIQ
jgi:hypothetical protein